jgi:NAD(P)-dependent dehydrogenase (short-subunit alcohol dehydrogenase family)
MADPLEYTVPDQGGRVALITGANSGLGLSVAERLAMAGADVILACRNQTKGLEAVARVQHVAPSAKVSLIPADLASQASVREAAKAAIELVDRIDILVNNAGVMAVPRELTEDGWELQLATNHLGHFALTGLLWPLLDASDSARVVSVSSNAHKFGRIRFDDLDGATRYNAWVAYAQSKLADLLFIDELQRRLTDAGSSAMALAAHPGWAATGLQLGNRDIGGATAKIMSRANNAMGQSADMGALPTLHAATSPHVTPGGFYGPGGSMEMRGFPVPVGRSSAAQDRGTAQRLWDISEQRTGVVYEV